MVKGSTCGWNRSGRKNVRKRCWKIAGRVFTTDCPEDSSLLTPLLISVTWLGASQPADFVVLDLGDTRL